MKRRIFSVAAVTLFAAGALAAIPFVPDMSFIGTGTNVLFSKDGSKANILMLATTTNPDAVAFNDLLSMAPLDENGKNVKRFQFSSQSGERLVSLACPFSKIVPETGSCTIVVYKSSLAQLDSANKRILLRLGDTDAARFAKEFHMDRASASGLLFESSDAKFRLQVEGVQNNVPAVFELSYGK